MVTERRVLPVLVLLGFLLCAPVQGAEPHDGQGDFDFSIGTWKTDLKRLQNPLTGSKTWIECTGTSVVSKVWNGRANLVELEVDCPSGHLQGLSLRLYNPDSRQWSLYYANSAGGTLSQPVIGEFKNGRGELFSQEPFRGRVIFTRFVITNLTPDSWRYEQSFSEDGGKTWEVNWIAIDTRVKGGPASVPGGTSGNISPVDFATVVSRIRTLNWTLPDDAANGYSTTRSIAAAVGYPPKPGS